MKLWKGVKDRMADTKKAFVPGEGRPPKMTRAEWGKRDRAKVTLTKGELEYLAHVLAVGRAMMRDTRPVPSLLKAAMTRLGVATTGL
jgi:hypothetical protein